MRNLKDQRFGQLTAIEYMGDSLWRCRCTCGNIKIVRSDNLTAKRRPVKSCGCLRKTNSGRTKWILGGYKSLIGHKYGKLKVKDHAVIGNKLKWHCVCECGLPYYATTAELRTGETTMCPMCQDELENEILEKAANAIDK